FTLKRGIDNYKGVSIDSAKFVMKSTEPNSPQGQMINAMYGEGFEYRWAFVNGLFTAVMGGDVDSAIRELIDEVKAGGPKELAGEMKSALALIPGANKADFVGTYNILRWFGIIGTMMPVPTPFTQMDIPTKSNIAFAGRIGQGKMTFEIALPKEHLMEMMGMIQMMQPQKVTIPKQPPSLVGKVLPELKDLKIELSPADINNRILICFWDMQQRPSRHCIRQLAKQAEQLKQKGVIVVAVQASKVDENTLNEWLEKNEIRFPVGIIEGDVEKVRFAWGVQSLPWLIISGRNHVVSSEGFGLSELNKKITDADDAAER
ncbi:MAG: redoxin domain-containing protein, partial [Phycisphaerae bacterium]